MKRTSSSALPSATGLIKRGVKAAAPPLAALATAFVAPACASSQPRANVSENLEQPSYVELDRSGDFEIRRVNPQIVAATTVTAADRDEASGKGFRILANYIFGDNTSRAAPSSEEIAMTAPVGAQPVPQATPPEKIAMTAPVGAKPVSEQRAPEKIAMSAPVAAAENATSTNADEPNAWDITFMMPSKYTLETLPVPNDERIRFEALPAQCQAAVVFSGFTTDAVIEEKTTALKAWLLAKDIAVDDTVKPTLARYNDPFTLPWNRRNEVLIDLATDACKGKATPPAVAVTTDAQANE